MNATTQEQIARALGRIASGCFILTARAGTKRTGMLASWVQQAGFEPPAVSVAVRKGRAIESLIDESKHFALNILGEDPVAMFKHFGRGFTLDEDAFAGLDAKDCAGGIVIANRIGRLSCRVTGKHDAGDHWLYVGEVIDAEGDDAQRPYVHLRRNGMNY
ncbi:MAG: flavin reductase family protein [Phycisphaerae bacterium]|nr:flavin reductase family protein [Phycisphaerae bacterium]